MWAAESIARHKEPKNKGLDPPKVDHGNGQCFLNCQGRAPGISNDYGKEPVRCDRAGSGHALYKGEPAREIVRPK